jgi:phosphatidylinositol alpha 1,6-mannosyltransferase
VRVALVTESFLPEVNGVTNSILRVVEHLERTGHPAMVIAPGSGPDRYAHAPVVRVRGVPVPRYRTLSLGLPSPRIETALRAFAPDVVHLASPFALGAHASLSAARLGLATVAVYQTDVAAFLARYGLGLAGAVVWRWLRRIHQRAHLTLAPSTAAAADLAGNGITGAAVWGRGVDGARFDPARRSDALRRRLAPGGELLVGYVGRLASEKRVELLAALDGLPGCRVVVVGDGPARAPLQARLPGASFLGFLDGDELAGTYASLDVFVHTGRDETFCQAAQEALSSGVPAVVPAAGGLRDYVRHEGNGLLWAPDRPDELRAAVARLTRDPALLARLRAAARPSVAHRTWTALGTELLGHYQAAIRAAGREAAA